MQENDTALLLDVAKEAGEIAKGFFRADPQVWEKDDNAGPVTEADLAVNDMLERRLQAARPAYGWLSEETEDHARRLDTKRQFVIDPIDGTRAFIEGTKNWAHSLAIVEEGKPVAAVVVMPMKDLTYHATLDDGAFLNGEAISVTNVAAVRNAHILTTKVNLRPENWINGEHPRFKMSFRSSLAYRMCLAAQGRFDGMLTLRPTWEWDIAAGALIVSEAGGKVCDQHGDALRLNNAHPQVAGVVAGGPIVDTLLKSLA